jgi:hypothetical protein
MKEGLRSFVKQNGEGRSAFGVRCSAFGVLDSERWSTFRHIGPMCPISPIHRPSQLVLRAPDAERQTPNAKRQTLNPLEPHLRPIDLGSVLDEELLQIRRIKGSILFRIHAQENFSP